MIADLRLVAGPPYTALRDYVAYACISRSLLLISLVDRSRDWRLLLLSSVLQPPSLHIG